MLNQAVIFCGGRGARLKSNTITKPKPMVIVKKKTFFISSDFTAKKTRYKKLFVIDWI